MITVDMRLDIQVKCFYLDQISKFTQLSQYGNADTEDITLSIDSKVAEQLIFRRVNCYAIQTLNGYVITFKISKNKLDAILVYQLKDPNTAKLIVYVIDSPVSFLKEVEDEYIKYKVSLKLASIADSDIYNIIQSEEVVDEFDVTTDKVNGVNNDDKHEET